MSQPKRSELIFKCRKCKMDTIYLSWSRLRAHEECRQRGYLRRIGKKEVINDHRNFLPGNITDRIVRDWLLNDPKNNPNVMVGMVEEYFLKSLKDVKEQEAIVKWKHNKDQQFVIDQCKLAVIEIEPYLNRYVVPYDYTPDYKFEVPIELDIESHGPVSVVLNGYMDILVRYPENKYGIFDVKHTTNNDYWKKTIGQLAFYDTATFLLTGEYSSIASLMQPLCKAQMKPFDIQPADRQKMWQSITSYAQDFINNNTEPTKDLNECGFCKLSYACIKFQPKIVNGKSVISL